MYMYMVQIFINFKITCNAANIGIVRLSRTYSISCKCKLTKPHRFKFLIPMSYNSHL